MWNTAPIISGLLFFTKRSQNYHTVFTKGVYYIDNETRGEKHIKTLRQPKGTARKVVNYEKKFTLYAELIQVAENPKR
jgi:hypothetical protein